MTESYSQMADRHATMDQREYDQELVDKWAPRLSPGQCEHCWRYSLGNPAKGWIRVFKPDSETVWVEHWKGFHVNCPSCNPDALGPEPGNPYTCIDCQHLICDLSAESCYTCGALKQFVSGWGEPECGAKHWQPILEVPPDV